MHQRLEKAGPNTRVEVAVWLRAQVPSDARFKTTRKRLNRVPRQVLASRKIAAGAGERFAESVLRRFDRASTSDSLAPVAYARLTKDQIKEAARRREVVAIFLHERDGIEDLQNSIQIANSDHVHDQGFRGSGVKVAVWEDGPDQTGNLVITDFFDPSQSKTSAHARLTHAIVRNKEAGKPKGHAPSCRLHSANDTDLGALRWAVEDRGCTVISQSFHRRQEARSGSLSFDDVYKDWLALHWPYPTIVQAAGNFFEGDSDDIDPPSSEFVNHKGYNSLAVGNHNDNATAMSGTSVFRNPSTDHGDRELPEISANGVRVTAVGRNNRSGTSFAAPAVAGCAALIQSRNSILKSWPEGCRAILLAGAKRNVQDDTWWKDVVTNVDGADGTGAVDALESLRVSGLKRNKNAAPTRRGWNVGSLRPSDFGSNGLSTFSYRVRVPGAPFGPRHVKVALAWTGKVSTLDLPFLTTEIPLSSNLTVDLDLMVFDSSDNLVGYAGSWDNSYEIAEFNGSPGETYTIRIRRWSGTDRVFYGVAWTVTGGLEFIPGGSF